MVETSLRQVFARQCYLALRDAAHFGHVVVMKKLGLTVVPLDLHARPIGSDDRALTGRAVMPSHAVAGFQSLGLVGCHDAILSHEGYSVPLLRTLLSEMLRRARLAQKSMTELRPYNAPPRSAPLTAGARFIRGSNELGSWPQDSFL